MKFDALGIAKNDVREHYVIVNTPLFHNFDAHFLQQISEICDKFIKQA